MNRTDCTHRRQAAIADTGEWACQDCGALMDPTNPARIKGTEDEVRADQERVRTVLRFRWSQENF